MHCTYALRLLLIRRKSLPLLPLLRDGDGDGDRAKGHGHGHRHVKHARGFTEGSSTGCDQQSNFLLKDLPLVNVPTYSCIGVVVSR